MTHPRVAAYRHRTFNAGFLAMNPKARPSQPDPVQSAEATSSLPRKRSLNVVSSSELARAADVERWLAECARLAVDLVVVASGPVARDVMTASPTRHPI